MMTAPADCLVRVERMKLLPDDFPQRRAPTLKYDEHSASGLRSARVPATSGSSACICRPTGARGTASPHRAVDEIASAPCSALSIPAGALASAAGCEQLARDTRHVSFFCPPICDSDIPRLLIPASPPTLAVTYTHFGYFTKGCWIRDEECPKSSALHCRKGKDSPKRTHCVRG